MKKETKYIITIGLLKSDMKTNIKEKYALNIVSKELIKNDIIGFKVDLKSNGFYNGIQEKNLIVSFINTYNIKTKQIIKIVRTLKQELNQECILLEKEKVLYQFV